MLLKLKNSIIYINKLMVFMCLCKQHLGNEKFKGFATFNPKNLSFDNEFQLQYKRCSHFHRKLNCDGGVDDILISSTSLSLPISTFDLLVTIGI
jgi:hypothetical protein